MSDMNNFQVGIIGGGPAGYTAAEAAAKAGLSVILFEKDNLGGVCLNEGCIPNQDIALLCQSERYGLLCGKIWRRMRRRICRHEKDNVAQV